MRKNSSGDVKIETCIVVFYFVALAAVHSAEAQKGFVNVDCGLEPKDATSEDSQTQLTYKSDLHFISTGESREVKEEYKLRGSETLSSLRAFPRGVRNCYDLNVTGGSKYLIRGLFMYGDYDEKNQLPEFDLYLGPNHWESVKTTDLTEQIYKELIHVPTSSSLSICLVKSGNTIPFISSLELRPLDDGIYTTSHGSLNQFSRMFFPANSSSKLIRYDDDPHDRFWSAQSRIDWEIISTDRSVDLSTSDYSPPESVMKSGVMPSNRSQPLLMFFSASNSTLYHVYLHFAEIEILNSTEIREFDIYVNTKLMVGKFRPRDHETTTIELTPDLPWDLLAGFLVVWLNKTETSTHPPLLNAMEIYEVQNFNELETEATDVQAMRKIKLEYGIDRFSWQGDPCVPQQHRWDGLNCSYKDSVPPWVTSLDLSSSRLTGPISPRIQNISRLESLDLSKNNLSGDIPEFLAEMNRLSFIDLSGNKLKGSIPSALLKKKEEGTLELILDSNSSEGKNSFVFPLGLAAGAVGVSIIAASLAFFFFRKRRKTQSGGQASAVVTDANTRYDRRTKAFFARKERHFTYAEILQITNNFEKKLGEGGFGAVYLGYIDGTDPVAVKMLSQLSAHGYKQFKAEVELLLRVHHRNLVSLVGYCHEGDNLTLIYDYMAKGDLEQYLSGKDGRNILSWDARVRIAAEAAQGLQYLHVGCKPPMVHRDVKTTNILLDENLQAKLGDFGLARSFSSGSGTCSQISTMVAGTPGYLDPEYFQTNQLSEKSDVYSFGIVLLQMITNRPAIDKRKEHITDWVKHMVNRGDIQDLVDPKLQGQYDINSVWRILDIAFLCVSSSSNMRPKMAQVLKELNDCRIDLGARPYRDTESNPQGSMELRMTTISNIVPKPR